jgi:hypothetical protein
LKLVDVTGNSSVSRGRFSIEKSEELWLRNAISFIFLRHIEEFSEQKFGKKIFSCSVSVA